MRFTADVINSRGELSTDEFVTADVINSRGELPPDEFVTADVINSRGELSTDELVTIEEPKMKSIGICLLVVAVVFTVACSDDSMGDDAGSPG